MGQSRPFQRSIVVVVSEDEEERALAATLFEEAGFLTTECASGEAALALFDAKRGEIAMIFTDLMLPGRIDGVELARLVRDKAPAISVIVTSGASRDRLRDLPDSTEYMPKPWRALELLIRAERVRADGDDGARRRDLS